LIVQTLEILLRSPNTHSFPPSDSIYSVSYSVRLPPCGLKGSATMQGGRGERATAHNSTRKFTIFNVKFVFVAVKTVM
jgi:hypothetical protein